ELWFDRFLVRSPSLPDQPLIRNTDDRVYRQGENMRIFGVNLKTEGSDYTTIYFYPNDGGEPITGLCTPNDDGTELFFHIPFDFPLGSYNIEVASEYDSEVISMTILII